eukprot:2908725-Amphidinium_carterae.1
MAVSEHIEHFAREQCHDQQGRFFYVTDDIFELEAVKDDRPDKSLVSVAHSTEHEEAGQRRSIQMASCATGLNVGSN